MKLEIMPTMTDNLGNGRETRCFHIASWPHNDASAAAGNLALYSDTVTMRQRKDYKCFPGQVFRIKRYYRLPLTLRGGPDPKVKEAIGVAGWMPIRPQLESTAETHYGFTVIQAECRNWPSG